MATLQEQKNIEAFNKVQQDQGTGKVYEDGRGVVSSNVITEASLAPIKPVIVPTLPPSLSIASDIRGNAEAAVRLNQQKLQEEQRVATENAKLNKDGSRSALKKTMDSILGVQSEQSNLEEEAGIAQKTNDANDIANKIEAKELSARRQIEELEKNKEGFFGNGLAQEINRVNRENARELADLSIIQNAKNRDLVTAQSLVDKKIALMLEPLKTTLDFQKMFYDENKGDFDKEEDRAFKMKISENERNYEEVMTKSKNLESTKLKLLASASEQQAGNSILEAIQFAQSEEEAIRAAGQYGGDVRELLIKDAQLRKLNAETSALNIPNITNPEAGQYSGALGVILGSAKFTKDQKAAVVNAINDGEDPFAVIRNQAKNIMGQSEATSVTKFETARSALVDLQSTLSQFYSNGGKTSIFSGNYEKVLNKLGNLEDPNLVELGVQIQSQLQLYRNAVSGTAYSEQEGKDISSIFPGINKTEGLNNAILRGRMKAFDSSIDGTYRATLGKSYDDLKKTNEPTDVPKTAQSVTVQGKQWQVGTVYEDAQGNRGTFDASGKWIKQ